MGALVPGRYPDGRELSTGLLLSLVGDIIGAAAAAAAVVLAAAVEEAGFLLPRPARGVVDLVVLVFLLGIGGMGDLPREDVRVRLVVTTLVEEGVLC